MSLTASKRRPRTRAETPFRWFVACGMDTYAALAGVRYDRIFREDDAIIEAFRVGEPKARELFGPDVNYGGPGWAGISYGHVNCLGAPLTFPEDSEVAHKPIYGSLDEGIRALEQKVDWRNAGMMPFYLELWEKLKKAFPDRKLAFGGFGHEGPLTTAWELRGHGFFTDIYDDPDRCKVYLRLVTESVVDYMRFIRSVNGQPGFIDGEIGMCDDIAAMIHPRLWPEMVLPFQELYFASQTSGPRSAHIEDLVPEHLHYLDALGLDGFDPSVSPRLKPADLRDRCRVPFWWRLNAMQVRDFSPAGVRQFVFESVADGASMVFCYIARTMLDTDSIVKIQTFISAAKQVAQLMGEGYPRSRLREQI